MNAWLAKEVVNVVAAVQRLHAAGESQVWIHFRRGSVVASILPLVEGYELVTVLTAPRRRSEEDLTDWVRLQLQKVPCCP